MKIRPKIIKAATGVKFTPGNANGANWRQQVFNNYRLHLLDLLAAYGASDDYGYWINDMQGRHAGLYNAANLSGNWEDTAYENELVGQYQHDYKGDLRFGQFNPKSDYTVDFNQLGIVKAQEAGRYDTSGPTRTSGDYGDKDFIVDNLYSAITDDRRILGRKGDWDEQSDEYNVWQNDLRQRGWEMFLDLDGYYKLRRLPDNGQGNPNDPNNPNGGQIPVPGDGGSVPASHMTGNGIDWSKLSTRLQSALPGILEAGRLAGTLASNARIFDDKLKGIRPNLQQTYNTHRLVVGDEGTKQAYYRRAAQGLTKANKPFTSDADRLMAYMMEARRVGDELRAQGDLADNAEIRRTSDESNQHLWANTQRATEVANRNIIELNNANAAKQDLIAQKHAADWTSINNYLLGRETKLKQRQAEIKAILDLIWALDELDRLSNDKEYNELYLKYSDLYDKSPNPSTDPKVIEAKKAFEAKKYQIRKRQLLSMLDRGSLWAKGGVKITYKKKDDLLYKTARDAVDHFRKMTKLMDDSTHRSRTKPIKLTSHPKKMQQGGVAPFLVFTPATVGGETTTTTDLSDGIGTGKRSGSSSKKKEDSPLDIIKELFSKLEGLPSDVNGIYSDMAKFLAKSQAFGESISTEDLSAMFLQQMQRINNIKFSKAAYDDAKKEATSKDALNEFAVDSAGRVAVQDAEGNLKFVKWDLIKEADGKLNPLTNNDLLNLRAYSKDMSFSDGIFNVVNNGIGVSKIAEFIKSNTPNLGDSELTIEGYTKKLSDQIRKGFELLLHDAPDGDYKYQRKTQDLREQMSAALAYIKTILPRNMQTVIGIHADLQGVRFDDMLKVLVGALTSTVDDLTFDAVTGKAAKDASGKSKEGDAGNSAGLAFVLGQGPRDIIEFNTGTSYATRVLGIRGTLQTKSDENLGQGATLQDATKSQQGGYLKWNLATFGGSKLNSTAYDHIILNDSTIMGVDLPVTKNLQGNEVPDFLILKSMEKADEEIRSLGIKENEYQKINEIYQKHLLPAKYDEKGNLNTHDYKRFAALQVTLDEASLESPNGILSDEVALAGDVERDLYVEAMLKSGKKDYDLDGGFLWTDWGRDLLYKGTIFVPYDEDIAFAALSSGKPFKLNLPDNASTIQLMQYAPATLSYKAPTKTLSQILNE